MISINSIIIYQNFFVFKGENLIQIHNLVNFIIENDKKIGLQLRTEISARFSVIFQFRAEVKKVTSRAENPSARAMARATLARAHHYQLCYHFAAFLAWSK